MKFLLKLVMNFWLIYNNCKFDFYTNIHNENVFSEQETGVDTRIIEINFLDDFVINDKLMELLNSIEIGILGNYNYLVTGLNNVIFLIFLNILLMIFTVNAFQVVMRSPLPFTKIAIEEINSILNANIKSLTLITYVVMSGMLQRNKGLILNLSAFSGLHPVPFISVYSASKVNIILCK